MAHTMTTQAPDNQMDNSQPIFTETQRLHQNTVVRVLMPLSVLGSVGVAVVVLSAQGAPWGAVAATIGIGVGVPLALAMLTQRTTVTEDAVRVRSVVGWALAIPARDVVSARAVRYNPIGDCGGWGLRKSRAYGLVLNVSGDRGVHARYAAGDGEKSALIGSRRSDELARAIVLAADVPLVDAGHAVAPPAAG